MKLMATAIVAAACLVVAVSPRVLAHEGHGLTMGEVVSVTGDTFELKTAKATLTLKVTADTKLEKDAKPAARALLKKGERVGVDLKKLDSGELLAMRIVFGVPAPPAIQD